MEERLGDFEVYHGANLMFDVWSCLMLVHLLTLGALVPIACQRVRQGSSWSNSGASEWMPSGARVVWSVAELR